MSKLNKQLVNGRFLSVRLILVISVFLLSALPAWGGTPTLSKSKPDYRISEKPRLGDKVIVSKTPELSDIGMKAIIFKGPDLFDITMPAIQFDGSNAGS